MDRRRLVAVTGANGFIGRWAVKALLAEGYRVRVFSRRFSRSLLFGGNEVEMILGNLNDAETRKKLLSGVDVVLHIAGLTKARNPQEFFAVNEKLVARLAEDAIDLCPTAHFTLISSLAAREPLLSPYAASKKAGEEALLTHYRQGSWTIFRPPAVYGPDDPEMRPLFKLAQWGLLLLPLAKNGRLSMIHAADLGRAILAGLDKDGPLANKIIEISDGKENGYNGAELCQAFIAALGSKMVCFHAPFWLLWLVAQLNAGLCRLVGKPQILMPHKIAELRHADWASHPPSLQETTRFECRYTLAEGLKDCLANG